MTDVTRQSTPASNGHSLGTGMPRRDVLRLGLAAGVALPATSGLVACAAGGGGASDHQTVAARARSATNPFGIDPTAPVDVVIFDGGFGDAYAVDAGKTFDATWKGNGLAKVTSTTKINTELQSRFVAGDPPDVIDNSGADSIGFAGIQDRVETLDDLLEAPAIGFPGQRVKDVLVPGAVDPGTFDGTLLQLNYFYTVYALWHSASLFSQKGFAAPTTWDEVMALGAAAKTEDLSLFVVGGQNAAGYYHELAISMAARQGGRDVVTRLENLEPDGYRQEAVQQSFAALKQAVDAQYFLPGGSGMIHTQAQTQFVRGRALLYPSGSWLENEMVDITPEGFAMTALQVPTLGPGPALAHGFHGAAGEPFVVPKGRNPAGGKEYLRHLLSKESATRSAQLVKSATVVTGTVPEDGFGSTALASATRIQNAGRDEAYGWRYIALYGLGKQIATIWNTFLSGRMPVAELTSQLQGLSDTVMADPGVKKFPVL
ncbi:N-acetylglucosamine/diacetylchitobiose ABC transporter substrate-binding protein [Dermatophilaceae bacterium Soc4.6]